MGSSSKRRHPDRVPRLPPEGVPLSFFRLFGEADPELCRAVARFVDGGKREYTVTALLADIGARPGFGFSRSRGYEILRAGRWLLLRERRVT